LTVESEYNKGSKVTLRLPTIRSPVPVQVSAQPAKGE
jgi:hypothetical protein